MSEETILALQQKLIETLKDTGALKSAVVEQALRAVPRHLFLPEEPLERAYTDIAIAVKRGEQGEWTSSSSQPAIMAIMLEQLELRPGLRIPAEPGRAGCGLFPHNTRVPVLHPILRL